MTVMHDEAFAGLGFAWHFLRDLSAYIFKIYEVCHLSNYAVPSTSYVVKQGNRGDSLTYDFWFYNFFRTPCSPSSIVSAKTVSGANPPPPPPPPGGRRGGGGGGGG